MIFVLPRAERCVPKVKLDEDKGRKKERYRPASQRAQFPIHFGRVHSVSIQSVNNEERWKG